MTIEFNDDELYTLRMLVKSELDELPDLINVLDGNDKKEMIEYKHKVEKLYDKIK